MPQSDNDGELFQVTDSGYEAADSSARWAGRIGTYEMGPHSAVAEKHAKLAPQLQDALTFSNAPKGDVLDMYAPAGLRELGGGQTVIPALARNKDLVRQIEAVLPILPTHHEFHRADARHFTGLKPNSVHLIVTSPPYWTLKEYNPRDGQLGEVADYDAFLLELDKVWRRCIDALVPGGRLVCVVGDVCLSRRQNNGRHVVMPLHASIQEHCRAIGYDNLASIFWYKIANATFESPRGSTFLGKPYEPNAIIKNDIEFILMERKPGGYRTPVLIERLMSVIPDSLHKKCFRQVWDDVGGSSTRHHPAPFSEELATRLIRMFSFVGDTVVDPFCGTGTTAVAAWKTGRNSVSVEIDEEYLDMAIARFDQTAGSLGGTHTVRVVGR